MKEIAKYVFECFPREIANVYMYKWLITQDFQALIITYRASDQSTEINQGAHEWVYFSLCEVGEGGLGDERS